MIIEGIKKQIPVKMLAISADNTSSFSSSSSLVTSPSKKSIIFFGL